MTPSQRQLIKEAYQEGYYGALNEVSLKGIISALRGLFKGAKTASKAPKTKRVPGLFRGKRRGIMNVGGGSPFPADGDVSAITRWIANNVLYKLPEDQIENYVRLLASYRNGNIDDATLMSVLKLYFPDLPWRKPGSGPFLPGDPDIPGIDPNIDLPPDF